MMMNLLVSLLACSGPPEAKTMGPRAACYTLEDEVPDQCLAMALEARDEQDKEAALYGLTIACTNGLLEACKAASTLPAIGVDPYDASLVVGRACFEQRRAAACRTYLSLQSDEPQAKKLIARAKAILAGTPESPPSEPASE